MAHAPPTEPSPPPSLPSSSLPVIGQRSRLALPAAVLCVAWVLGLAGMVLQSSDPVTLNRQQIEVSMMFVQAEVTRLVPGEIRIEKSLLGSGEDGQLLLVRNLNQTPAQVGQQFLFPLVPARDRTGSPVHGLYDVTPTGLPDNQPLIYPGSAEALRQFETLRK